ncbi:helix-turn-helix transcriptional regulator [Streptomyces sp. NPDC055722]
MEQHVGYRGQMIVQAAVLPVRADMDRHTRDREREAPCQVAPPRFVGREVELGRLADALSRPPAVVLVEGEAGIGKSRLIREAVEAMAVLQAVEGAAVPGRRVLTAVCPPFREPMTLGPIVDAVRQARADVSGLGLTALAGTLRPFFPEWAEGLPDAPEPLADARAARHRLMRALAELLDRIGIEVLIVEDVHWADEATMEFLLFLASQQPQQVSLLLTYRPEDLPADSLLPRLSSRLQPGVSHARIALGGLGALQVTELVSSMLGGEHVSTVFAAFLHEHTEGVPLALEESVRLLHDRADLVRRDGRWTRRSLGEIAVPPSLRDAVAERVRGLHPAAQVVLLAAAVLIDPADEAALSAVSGLPPDQTDPAIREAVRSGLVAEDDAGRIAFRHVLAARAVYDRAAGPDRRDAHQRAAGVLEAARHAPVGRLAYHFRKARDVAKWRRYAEQAADLALSSGDHPTAVTFLTDLLDESGLPGGDVARIAKKMPLLAFTGYLGRVDLVSRLRAVLADERFDVHDRARIRAQLGRMLMHAGELEAGSEEVKRAIPDLADSPFETAQAMIMLGGPSGLLWPAKEHRRWLDLAARVPDASMSEGDRQSLLIDRTTALLGLGEASGWDLARQFSAEVSTSQGALMAARASLNFGNAAMRWGRYPEARRRLANGADIAGRHRYQRLRDLAAVTLVHLDWFTGAWAGLAERAGRWAQLDEEPLIQLDSQLVIGLLGAAAGGDRSTEDTLRLVRDESARRGVVDMSLESTAALARLRLARRDVAGALALTDEAEQVVAGKGMWLWATETVPVRVEALVLADRRAEAEALVAAFDRGLEGRDVEAARAALLSCRGLLAEGQREYAAAAAAWHSAAAAWQNLPRPYEALLARERQAGCLLGAGDRAAALAQWAAVARELLVLGARSDADRVLHTLREHGAVTGDQPGAGRRRGYGHQLSPKELDVVVLLLGGLSNREIADTLSRSPKTVAAQLNSAMRKHRVSSRTALAVVVTQRALNPDFSAEVPERLRTAALSVTAPAPGASQNGDPLSTVS